MQDTKIHRKSHYGIRKILSDYQRVTVPVELIEYCWHEKALTPLKIFLTLKLYTTGRILLDKARMQSIMKFCNIRSARTLKKHLNWLIENHWLCIDREHGIYYIKSWQHIFKILNLQSTKSVLIRPQIIPDFRIWCASVLIAKKVNEINWRLRSQDQRKGRRSVKGGLTSKTFYAGLSDSKVAELLNVSAKEAWKLKRQAHESGYLSVKKRFKFISDTPMTLLYGMHGKFRVFNGKIWERSYDEIQHFMKFKPKKLSRVT